MTTVLPVSALIDDRFLTTVGGSESIEWLDSVGIEDYESTTTSEGTVLELSLVPLEDGAVADGTELLSLGGFDLLLGPWGSGQAVTSTVVVDEDQFSLSLSVPLSLRLGPPTVRKVDPTTMEPLDTDSSVVIPLGEPSVTVEFAIVDGELDVEFSVDAGGTPLSLPPLMIGETGVIVEATDIALNLSGDDPTHTPSNAPAEWKGLYIGGAKVHLPDLMDGHVLADDFGIGTGGVTGTVDVQMPLSFDDTSGQFTGDLAGEVLGLTGGVSDVTLTFVESVPTGGAVGGQVLLPFFDRPVGVLVSVDAEGGFTAGLTGIANEESYDKTSGLFQIEREMFTLEIASLTFEIDEETAVVLTGELQPSLGVDLPAIALTDLRLSSDGSVSLPGGWLDLGDQYSAEVEGFAFDITQFGMGHTDDGRKWLGLSGGIKLLEGLPMGSSVEGLRVTWDESNPTDFEVSLDGVGIEFEVPNTVKFKGEVSLRDEEFRGEIDLELLALDMTIDAEVVFGTVTYDGQSFDYLGVSLDANLPAGIPLWATGLSLYGFGGLFANKLEPDKKAGQQWFAVSKKADESWFHESPQGVTGLEKWRPATDAMGFGASVDLATTPDNGLSVATDLALVFSFPGPIIMLQGRAELLEEGTAVDDDAPFQALMVLDNRAGSVTLGVDAHYDNSPLLDISAAAEAYYSFSDPRAWYLNLGRKDPREDRIRAEALSIFTAEAFLMLNPERLATGIWTGYDKSWKFGPLKVAFAAWVSGDAVLNFQPAHFHGSVQFHGEVSLSAFGFGLGLTVDAGVEADVFDPFHLLGTFSVKINLPWPLPDPKAKVTLEWGPEPELPALPDPLEAVGIGHEKFASTWNGEFVHELTGSGSTVPAQPTDAPSADTTVVPLDARPEVTFARPVHDVSGVTNNPSPPAPPYELVGDPSVGEGPMKVRYELSELSLLKWDPDGATWVDAGAVTGTWAPVPAGGSGDTIAGAAKPMTQTKLQVSTRTPYHYSRRTGGAWENSLDLHFPQYPCSAEQHCYDFDGLTDDDFDDGTQTVDQEQWLRYQRTTHAEDPWVRFFLRDEGSRTPGVNVTDTTGASGTERALTFRESDRDRENDHEETHPHRVRITLPKPLRSIRLRLRSLKYPAQGVVYAYNSSDDDAPSADRSWAMDGQRDRTVVFTDDEDLFYRLDIEFEGSLAILEVCTGNVDLSTPGLDLEASVEETRAQLARWGTEGEVLEPYTDYRLKVVTTTHALGQGEFDGVNETKTHSDYIAFRTEGPPGISIPDLPVGSEKTLTGLETLARYVHQTTPATVPAEGERPPLPRPVYRGDPAGVDFNVDYTDLLYRLANRDLALYLYDSNDTPVRDAEGRLVVEENQWGTTESLLLDRASRRWFARLDASPCIDLDDYNIELTKRLVTGDDRVLEPDSVYEARLRPLLYRTTWADGTTGWSGVDEGTASGSWLVEGHESLTGSDATALMGARVKFAAGSFLSMVEAHRDTITFAHPGGSETYTIVGVNPTGNELTLDRAPGSVTGVEYEIPAKYELKQSNFVGSASGSSGTFFTLVSNPDLEASDPDQPTDWSDVRVRTTVGTDSAVGGVIGLVFRRRGSTYYRVELDSSGRCRLHRVEGGTTTQTWSGNSGYLPGLDTTITVEAIGPAIQVLVNDEPALSITDSNGPTTGSVGPYCRGTNGFRCQDLRVDDFRKGAPIAYRFSFTTSQFVDAFHQIHSYDDEVWLETLAASELPTPDTRGDPGMAPTPEEHRTYDTLGAEVDVVDHLPERFEVTRLLDGSTTTGLFLHSPEPIDWSTTSLTIERGPRFDTPPTRPAALKLTEFDFDTETLSLLFREGRSLDGDVVEYRRSDTEGFYPTNTAAVIDGSFAEPEALDSYDLVDPAGDASWTIEDERARVEAPSEWSAAVHQDVVVSEGVFESDILIDSDAEVGIVFRYRDPSSHYRVVVDTEEVRLLSVSGGSETLYWSRPVSIEVDQLTPLRVTVGDGEISVSLNGVLVGTARDPTPTSTGRVGVVAVGTAAITHLGVFEESMESVLLDSPFETPEMSDWTFVKEPPYSTQTPDWQFADGELRQLSNVYGFAGGQYAEPGTYGVTGNREWTDYRTTVRLQSDDDDVIGVIVRYQDDDHYYRFSMDAQREYRRLVRKHDGQTDLLWEDEIGFEVQHEYTVTIDCVGGRLTGYLDGAVLFDLRDDTIASGAVGVYCRANKGARFESLRVVAPGDRWIPYHTFELQAPQSAGTRLSIQDAPLSDTPRTRRIRLARNGPEVGIPSESVHFRVRSATSTTTHVRQFRADGVYATVTGISVVRSRDGTGTFVFRDDGFDEGQYRIELRSTRGGQFDVPVQIDLPWGEGP